MDDTPGTRVIASENRNSAFVLALLHRVPPSRFGHRLATGLRPFGVAMLFGIEPRVLLFCEAAPYLPIAGREANDNPLYYPTISIEEWQRRLARAAKRLGHPIPLP